MSKNLTHIEEQLEEITVMLKNGHSETEIVNRLGVSLEDWQEYKWANPELWQRLERIKEEHICQIQSIIWKLAQGYEYKDTTIIKRTTSDGEEIVSEITRTKHVPPDLEACKALLKMIDDIKTFSGVSSRPLPSSNSLRAMSASKPNKPSAN